MGDQAEKLRKLMTKVSKNEDMNKKHNKGCEELVKSKAQVISITSGKGGVGKTNFTINLAITLKRFGYKVVVFDGDIGLANAGIVSGIINKYTIVNLLQDDTKDIFEIMNEGPEGIKLISGGSGFKELSLVNENGMNQIIAQLEILEEYFDFILIDTGAGLSDVVVKLIMASDEVILVTTPDPTSLMDGYVLLKALTIDGYKGKLKVVVNMVENRREAQDVYKKLSIATKRFLRIDLEYLGYFQRSNVVTNAVKTQRPFVISNPNSQVSKKIKVIGLGYINESNENVKIREMSFTERLRRFFFG